MKTIKKIFVCIILFMCVNNLPSQVKLEDIAKYNGSSGAIDAVIKLLKDNSGNLYTAGNSSDGTSSFITLRKYNSQGSLIWQKIFNSQNSIKNIVIGAGIDSSGNIIIGGSCYNSSYNILLVKFNPEGNTIWERTYNGNANSEDTFNSLCIDSSGNIYVSSAITNLTKTIGILKYSSSGNLIWEKFFSSFRVENGIPYIIKLDKNGFIYLTGSANNGAVTMKYSPSGDSIWTRIYNVPGGDSYGTSLIVDESLNVFITGTERLQQGLNTFLTLKYNQNGDLIWEKKFSEQNSSQLNFCKAEEIAKDNSGNIYVTGTVVPVITDNDYFSGLVTIKYSESGDSIWTHRFNRGTTNIFGTAVLSVSDSNNIFISSYLENYPYYLDVMLIKLNSSGLEEWRYTDEVRGEDKFTDNITDGNGNVYAGGYLNSDLIIMKFAQDGQKLWENNYNSAGFSDDNFSVILKDFEGNYYISAYNNSEYILLKYNQSFDVIWTRTFTDSSNSSGPGALRIASDTLGNLFATCIVNMNDRINLKVYKLSNSGEILWSRIYASSGYSIIGPKSLAVDRDQNAVVIGYDYNTSSLDFKILVLKYSQNGDLLLEKIHNNSTSQNSDRVEQMKLDNEDNMYIVGSYGEGALTLKLDPLGNQLWERLYTNGQPYVKSLSDLFVDQRGNVFVTGFIGEQNQSYNYLSIKYDSSGNQKWARTFNGLRNDEDFGKIILSDSAGNAYVTGEARNNSSNFNSSMITIKYDSAGNTVWMKNIKSSGNSSLSPASMVIDKFSNVYILNGKPGIYNEGFLTVKYKSNGDSVWSFHYNSLAGIPDNGSALLLDNDNNVIISGKTYSSNTSYDITMIKLSQIVGINNLSLTVPDKFSLSQNYPNPFNPLTVISYQLAVSNVVNMKVYDALGKEVATLVNEKQNAGSYSVEFNGEGLPSGVYFYKLVVSPSNSLVVSSSNQLESSYFIETKRMVLLK